MTKKEFALQQLDILDGCYIEAPVDFLGTGSDSNYANEEEAKWRADWESAYNNLLNLINEWEPQGNSPVDDGKQLPGLDQGKVPGDSEVQQGDNGTGSGNSESGEQVLGTREPFTDESIGIHRY